MNHREVDIENVKEQLRNMKNQMKKYNLHLIGIPERGYSRNLSEAIFEKVIAENYPELKDIYIFKLVHTGYLAE